MLEQVKAIESLLVLDGRRSDKESGVVLGIVQNFIVTNACHKVVVLVFFDDEDLRDANVRGGRGLHEWEV